MNISISITKPTDNLKDTLDAMKELDLNHVLIGVPASNAERHAQNGEQINNAQIGYLMENGAPEQNIPARAFLAPGVMNIQAQAIAQLKAAGQGALSGDKTVLNKTLNALGMLGRDSVKAKITDGPFAPLAPATIKARLRRRRGLSLGKRKDIFDNLQPGDIRPLIDTGQLRNAITYVVRRK